jgi:glycosyltransferase involved in cell wall biosynthesis
LEEFNKNISALTMSNITFLTPWLTRSGGGLQSSVRDLVLALICAGGDNYKTIGIEDHHIVEDIKFWNDAAVRMHSYLGPESFRFSPGFIYDVANLETDLFQLHGLWMSPSFSLMVRNLFRKSTPLLVSPHGMLDPWIINRNVWKKNLARYVWENAVWKSASVFRALNLVEAAAIKNLVPSKPVCVIPNGIVAIDRRVVDEYRLARVQSAPILLYLGRLHEKKCVLELVEAWKKFKSGRRSDWILQIAGWGDQNYQNSVIFLINEIRDSSIHFLGPVFGEQKTQVLAGASAFILPSRSEGLPVSVLEACTYGLLPIISKDCNLPELVSNYSALLVGTEVNEIALALSTLNDMPLTLVASRGEALHRYVSTKYAWTDIAAQFHSVQDWCIKGGDRPAGLFI